MRLAYASGISVGHLHGRYGQDLRRIFYLLGRKLTFGNAGELR